MGSQVTSGGPADGDRPGQFEQETADWPADGRTDGWQQQQASTSMSMDGERWGSGLPVAVQVHGTLSLATRHAGRSRSYYQNAYQSARRKWGEPRPLGLHAISLRTFTEHPDPRWW